MDINIIFKIAAVGILTAILNQLLVRSGREDIGLMATIAGLIIVLLMVAGLIGDLFDQIRRIFLLY